MKNNLTIVIPNRNRDLKLVQRSLKSIYQQLDNSKVLTLVDYGSDLKYQQELALLLKDLPKVRLILCPAQGQLFHKTRAINIVLRNTTSTYFMVLDMDCICHPKLIEKALELVAIHDSVNFPYGFLSEEESRCEKSFDDYQVDFIGGLTGTAIFKTRNLLYINGFDEVYHNWGAEDADIFDRLERSGVNTTHYKDELLVLHQWHEKQYRKKGSKLPYHAELERINHDYLRLSRKLNRKKANQSSDWGLNFDLDQYKKLSEPGLIVEVNSTLEEMSALCLQLKECIFEGVVLVKIKEHKYARALKTRLKALLHLKQPQYISVEDSNRLLLETIILNHRNQPYRYSRSTNIISLSIILSKNKNT